ncbi:MAG: hypothetical protein ACE5G5_12140 [Candidatus Methylomirabilales bacterium]
MITWSVVAAVLGLCGGGAAVTVWRPGWSPERYWLLGMATLFPAWLIAFLGILAASAEALPRGAFIGSSSLPLIGAIITDTMVKRLRQSGRRPRPTTYWLLGVAALLPAWVFAILSIYNLTQ